jgi:PAS domain S-box-containing protein
MQTSADAATSAPPAVADADPPALVLPWSLVLLAGPMTALALVVGQGTGTLGAWWPAAGIGVLAVLLSPRDQRPRVVLGLAVAFVAGNLVAGRDLLPSALLGLADTLEVVVVVAVLHRLTRERLARLGDLTGLIVAVVAGATVAGVGMGATYAVFLDMPFLETLRLVWPAHGASVLVLAPLALVDWRPPRTIAAGPVTLGLVMAGALVIGFGPVADGMAGIALTSLPLPLLVWAAVRHGTRVVVLDLVMLAVVLTLTGLTYPTSFTEAANGASSATVQVVQVYLICMVLIALPLSLAMREREAAMSRTADSERTFKSVFTRSGLPVLLLRWTAGELRVTDANAASEELLGSSARGLVGCELSALLHAPDLLSAVREADLDAGATFPGWNGPMGVVGSSSTRLDGYCSLMESGHVLADEGASYCLHLVDLTARHELQRRLEDERTYTRAVMDTASSLIVVTDAAGTVIAANPATLAVSGYAEDELVGRPFWDTLIPAQHRHTVSDALAHPASLPRTGEFQLRTKAGEERSLVYSHALHRDTTDLVAATSPVLVFSAIDVTDARESAGMVEHLLRSLTTMAFIGTDLDGAITLFSTGAERLLRLSAEQARGRDLAELLAPVDAGAAASGPVTTFADLVSQAGPETLSGTRDWLALSEGRAPVRVSVTSSPVVTDHGTMKAHLFVARDVTEMRRNQEILVNALRREREVVHRLQALDRAKDDFVSTVSHELRTPMSSIIGSAEMLGDGLVGELEPRQQQMVEVITRNGARLLALADDLLALATFDREAWSAPGERLDLRDIVRESVAVVEPLLSAKPLTHALLLPDQPVEVIGEASQLERAVSNLLTNAVKFTPDGGRVEIEVVLDDRHREALVHVRDTGLGVAEEDLAHVFERFYRADEVQQQAIQGSGLGLAIVKSIVERHDGRVSLSSTPGQGTTASLSLPLARSVATERPARERPTPE